MTAVDEFADLPQLEVEAIGNGHGRGHATGHTFNIPVQQQQARPLTVAQPSPTQTQPQRRQPNASTAKVGAKRMARKNGGARAKPKAAQSGSDSPRSSSSSASGSSSGSRSSRSSSGSNSNSSDGELPRADTVIKRRAPKSKQRASSSSSSSGSRSGSGSGSGSGSDSEDSATREARVKEEKRQKLRDQRRRAREKKQKQKLFEQQIRDGQTPHVDTETARQLSMLKKKQLAVSERQKSVTQRIKDELSRVTSHAGAIGGDVSSAGEWLSFTSQHFLPHTQSLSLAFTQQSAVDQARRRELEAIEARKFQSEILTEEKYFYGQHSERTDTETEPRPCDQAAIFLNAHTSEQEHIHRDYYESKDPPPAGSVSSAATLAQSASFDTVKREKLPSLSLSSGESLASSLRSLSFLPLVRFDPPSLHSFLGVENEPWEKHIQFEHRDNMNSHADNDKRQLASALAREDPTIEKVVVQSDKQRSSTAQPLSFSSFDWSAAARDMQQTRPAIHFQLKRESNEEEVRWQMEIKRRETERRAQQQQHRPAPLASRSPLLTMKFPAANGQGHQASHSTTQSNDSLLSASQLFDAHCNHALDSDSWLAAIVWSDADFAARRALILSHQALLLDYNDKELVLGDYKPLLATTDRRKRERPTDSSASDSQSLLRKPLMERFNISHDQFYDVSLTSVRSHSVVKLIHAEFAANLSTDQYRSTLNERQLRKLHRPTLAVIEHGANARAPANAPVLLPSQLPPLNATVAIPVRPYDKNSAHSTALLNGYTEEAASFSSRFVPSNPEDLSASEGRILVCEFLERDPLLLANTGMASSVITYYRKKDDTDETEPRVEDGDVVILSGKDESPFLGDVRAGTKVTALQNTLFVAPIQRHSPPANTFLLIRTEQSWMLRSLPACYIVGQLEPKVVVPTPHSVEALEHVRKRAESFVFHLFARAWDDRHAYQLQEHEIQTEGFDGQQREFINTILRDVAYLNPRTRCWTLKESIEVPTESALQQLYTPEDVCAFESMRAGYMRLRDHGLHHLYEAKQVADLIEPITVDEVRRPARFIEKLLQLTPWSLTRSFLQAGDGRGLLQLDGRGNPFAQGAGFSYILRKSSNKARERPKDEEALALAEPKKKTGTNADLRKLTMEEMELALKKLGVGESEIKGMLRWDRVRAIARLSREAVQEGRYPNLKRFARTVRHTNAQQQEEYRAHIQQIFDRELAILAYTSRPDYQNELDDDVAANPVAQQAARQRPKPAARITVATSQKKRERREEEEYKEFLAERERHVKEASTSTTKGSATGRVLARASPSHLSTPGPSTTAMSARAASPSSSLSARPGRRTRHLLVTRLEHVVKLTLKDGSSTVERRVYDDPELLTAFYNDLRIQTNDARTEAKRLRQALNIDQTHALQRQQRRESKKQSEDEEDEDEKEVDQPTGAPLIELRSFATAPGTKPRAPFLDTVKRKFPHARLAGSTETFEMQMASAIRRKIRSRRGDSTLDQFLSFDPSAFDFIGATTHSIAAGVENDDEMAEATLPAIQSTNATKLPLRNFTGAQRLSTGGANSRKRKSTGNDDDSDDYEEFMLSSRSQSNRRKVTTRRRGDPRIHLSAILEEIVTEAMSLPESAAFRQPVTEQEEPDYQISIDHPMDLRTIRTKCRDNRYDNRQQFLDDVKLIQTNCEQYNGVNHDLSKQAQRLTAYIADQMMEEQTLERLLDSEEQVERAMIRERIKSSIKLVESMDGNKIFRVNPTFAQYLADVPQPISLATMTDRVDRGIYTYPGEFLADLTLMKDNSVRFNGLDHLITRKAQDMVDSARAFLRGYYGEDQLKLSTAHRTNPVTSAVVRQSSSTKLSAGRTPTLADPFTLTASAGQSPAPPVIASPSRSPNILTTSASMASPSPVASTSNTNTAPPSPSPFNFNAVKSERASSIRASSVAPSPATHSGVMKSTPTPTMKRATSITFASPSPSLLHDALPASSAFLPVQSAAAGDADGSAMDLDSMFGDTSIGLTGLEQSTNDASAAEQLGVAGAGSVPVDLEDFSRELGLEDAMFGDSNDVPLPMIDEAEWEE